MAMKTSKPAQLTQGDVERLYRERRHEEIEAARVAGRLDDVLHIERHWPPASGPWSAEDLTAMRRAGRNDEINAARAAGQLSVLFGDTAAQASEEIA